MEALAFEHPEELGEQCEITRRRFGRGDRAPHAAAQHRRKGACPEQRPEPRDQQWKARERCDEESRRQPRQRERCSAQCERRRRWRRRAPLQERFRVQTGGDGLPDQRERLAQVERRGELRDRVLAAADRVGVGGREQPRRECRLASRRSRAAEQIEEATAPEEVQVVGVRVFGIAEARAVGAVPGEGAVEPRHAVLVIADRALAGVAPAQHPIVGDDEADEAGDRQDQPARVESPGAEGDTRDDEGEREDGEPRLRDARRARPRRTRVVAPRREALLVGCTHPRIGVARGDLGHGGGVSRTRQARASSCR